MQLREAIGHALYLARKSKGITQEDFGAVSSRTYVSTLERGLNSVTLDKLDEICSVIGIHPLTIITHAYLNKDNFEDARELLRLIEKELNRLN